MRPAAPHQPRLGGSSRGPHPQAPTPPPLTPRPAEDPSRSAFSMLPKLPLELEGLVPSSSNGEAVLKANGFPEAAECIDQPHVRKELKNIADHLGSRAADPFRWRCVQTIREER